MPDDDTIHIWTDGACLGNPGGPGGWAYLARQGETTFHQAGGVPAQTTNIEMEMTAVIQALRDVRHTEVPVIIHTDCEMIVKALREWMAGWIAKGWRKGDGKPVASRAFWEVINALLADRPDYAPAQVEWVRGHAGCTDNERADHLAECAAREAAKTVGRRCQMPGVFDPLLGLVVPAFGAAA